MEPILFLPILLAVFLPLFILFVGQRRQRNAVRRQLRRERRETPTNESQSTECEEAVPMTNELIRSLIGKTCQISTGSLGEAFDKVQVVDVQENWIRVERKHKVRLINADYVTSVKILEEA